MIGMNRTMADPRRWISKGCPKNVDAIANIYVKLEEFNDRMEREVRDWFPTFSCTDDGIAGRRRGAGCEAALGALRDMDGVDLDSMPTLRWGFDSDDEMLLLEETFLKKVFPQPAFPGRHLLPKTFCDPAARAAASALKAPKVLECGRATRLRYACSTLFCTESCIILHNPASLGCGSHCLRGDDENPASLASGSH